MNIIDDHPVLEPAIPEHLRVERTIPTSTPANYQPPFPAYSPRFPKDAKDLVTAIIGVQQKDKPDGQSDGFRKLVSFVEAVAGSEKLRYWEAAAVTDNRGYYNEVLIPYWASKQDYEKWSTESGFDAWWSALQPSSPTTGYFLEVFLPSVERFETVFSDNKEPEGASHMRVGISGAIQEHVYWGSMRDRLPASQTDHLKGEKASIRSADDKEDTRSRRITVPGRKNLAMIRSGQDWSGTASHERTKYLETMHPVLTKGMHFLRDQGSEVGCISCRFMDVIPKDYDDDDDDDIKDPTDKTFGLAYFDDLASLEDWSKRHRTHLDIFSRFLQYAQELQGNVGLRLFHEVMVLEPGQQFFEYVGCHSTTGMLASV